MRTLQEVVNNEDLQKILRDQTTPVAVGVDRDGMPFLVSLTGPDGVNEHILFDSPWRGECPYCLCTECVGHVHGTIDLKFPVKVILASG